MLDIKGLILLLSLWNIMKMYRIAQFNLNRGDQIAKREYNSFLQEQEQNKTRDMKAKLQFILGAYLKPCPSSVWNTMKFIPKRHGEDVSLEITIDTKDLGPKTINKLLERSSLLKKLKEVVGAEVNINLVNSGEG